MLTLPTTPKDGTRKRSLLLGFVFTVPVLFGCSANSSSWDDLDEDGSFLMYRRQSLIGEETYRITSNTDSIVINSSQGENERGRVSGVEAELRLNNA